MSTTLGRLADLGPGQNGNGFFAVRPTTNRERGIGFGFFDVKPYCKAKYKNPTF
jgi:hypothetical protein